MRAGAVKQATVEESSMIYEFKQENDNGVVPRLHHT